MKTPTLCAVFAGLILSVGPAAQSPATPAATAERLTRGPDRRHGAPVDVLVVNSAERPTED
jgi:hypothetical protein